MVSKKKNKQWNWIKSHRGKKVIAVFRWLHIYISTALFGLLIFFCITGVFLNHLDWFDSIGQHEVIQQKAPKVLVEKFISNDNNAIVAFTNYIEKKYNWHKPNKVNIDFDLGEATFDYKMPAGYIFITLFFDSNEITIEKQSGTFIAVLNDLHKGRNTGDFWSVLIDFSAYLIILFSISGVVILLQQIKWRKAGLWLVFIGFISPVIFYYFLVPQI